MAKFSPRKAIAIPEDLPRTAIAVLASGGLQSSVLMAFLLESFDMVYPVYVRQGQALERAEEEQLQRFLAALRGPTLSRLTILESTETRVNQTVISRASEWCATNGIETIALGTLDNVSKGNISSASANENSVRVICPFQAISRTSVLELGRDLPLKFTFSCHRPIIKGLKNLHCGRCLKCQMRQLGFKTIQIKDQTEYASKERIRELVASSL